MEPETIVYMLLTMAKRDLDPVARAYSQKDHAARINNCTRKTTNFVMENSLSYQANLTKM
jgi:putative cell wall-binding protein